MKARADFESIPADIDRWNKEKDFNYTERELEELADVARVAWESNSAETLEEIEENLLLLSEFISEDVLFERYIDREAVGLAPGETIQSLPQGERRNEILDKIDNLMSECSDVYEIRYLENGEVLLAWI